MKHLITLVMLAAPTLAAAEDWHGIWASEPGICQYKNQLGGHDPTPILYSATEFIGLENRCEVKGSQRVGGLPAWRLTLTCTGEGTTYDEDRLLMISDDGRLWEFDGIWEPFGYTRCE